MGRCAFLYLALLAALLPVRATRSETGCNTDWCTSPDGKGGYDCWAGSPKEPCTCSEGKAKETGESGKHMGQTYYEYVCCTDGTNGTTGEHCGDFKEQSDKESNEKIGAIVSIVWVIGLGVCIWACWRRRVRNGGSCCQPRSESHSGESTNHTQQPMWSSTVELARHTQEADSTKNDDLVPDAYKTPDNYYR